MNYLIAVKVDTCSDTETARRPVFIDIVETETTGMTLVAKQMLVDNRLWSTQIEVGAVIADSAIIEVVGKPRLDLTLGIEYVLLVSTACHYQAILPVSRFVCVGLSISTDDIDSTLAV